MRPVHTWSLTCARPKMKLILLVSFVLFLIRSSTSQDVVQLFQSYGVVVDILDTAPTALLDITYPVDKKITFGEMLKPSEVQTQPAATWFAESNAYYTLIMVDLDAPSFSQPTYRSVKHWLVGNIQGNDINTGDMLASYGAPQPPQGTGPHRYVLLLYKQNCRINFDEPQTDEPRLNFNVRNFMQKYNLGSPIAGNLFECRWESN